MDTYLILASDINSVENSSQSPNVLQDLYFQTASRYPESSIGNKVYNDEEAYVQQIFCELL